MIRSLYHAPDGAIRTDLPSDEFGAALLDRRGLLWVDFEATPPETDEPILRDVFGFHHLAVSDALQQSHVPKVDDWSDYLYLVLHAAVYEKQNGGHVDTLEVDVFLGQHFIVTHHDKPIEAIKRVWSACQRDERTLRNGADHLLYRLADEIVASYMPVVESIDGVIDRIEDRIFKQPSPEILRRIFTVKRAVLRLRRILGPQREVLNKLARDDFAVIDPQDRIYFRDVYDHLVRLYDIAESVRDLVSGALDTYLSVVNNRMNEIVKTLTIITTVFMPLSFIVGFFGMNFFQPSTPLDIWTGMPAFWITLGVLAATPAVMYLWMRRRGWM
jgi:magnesium transporter